MPFTNSIRQTQDTVSQFSQTHKRDIVLKPALKLSALIWWIWMDTYCSHESVFNFLNVLWSVDGLGGVNQVDEVCH